MHKFWLVFLLILSSCALQDATVLRAKESQSPSNRVRPSIYFYHENHTTQLRVQQAVKAIKGQVDNVYLSLHPEHVDYHVKLKFYLPNGTFGSDAAMIIPFSTEQVVLCQAFVYSVETDLLVKTFTVPYSATVYSHIFLAPFLLTPVRMHFPEYHWRDIIWVVAQTVQREVVDL